MYMQVRKQLFIIGLIIMLVSVSMGFSVSAQNHLTGTSTVFLESRFKLWDINEKMMNKDFNITMYYFNVSNNHSANYKIIIDENEYEGDFIFHCFKNFTVKSSKISKLEVLINNKTVLLGNNIAITSIVSKSLIDYASSEWTINLSPFEWTQKEQNIFIAVVICSILSVLIAYKFTTKYRKGRGIKTHK